MTNKLKRRSTKTTQWSFVFTVYDDDLIDRLKNALETDVLYTLFSVCRDNTGNSYLRGFVRATKRIRISGLEAIMGCRGSFTPCASMNLSDELKEIKMHPYWEVGNVKWLEQQGVRKDIIGFKDSVDKGVPCKSLKMLYPLIFRDYPRMVLEYTAMVKNKRNLS